MPQLYYGKEFLESYGKLEKRAQKAVLKAIDLFPHQRHAGMHLEKLKGARDPNIRTIRINDYYRGVVLAPKRGDAYQLITVLGHDEANAYATSKRFTVNQAFGVLEDRDQGKLDDLEPALRMAADKSEQRLFEHVKDSDLVRLSIDADVLPIVRLLTSQGHLDALERLLPDVQYHVLLGLAAGMSPDEVWRQLSSELVPDETPSEVDTENYAAAAARTPDKYAMVSGPEELREMLESPFAAWRVFLHPKQRSVAYRSSYRGPVLISGGPGTGKTVTAVHRAAFLAEQARPEQSSVLLTTFNRGLAESLTKQFEQLVEDTAIRSRVEVLNVDRLAYQIVAQAHGKQPTIVDERDLSGWWAAAAEKIGHQFTPAFLQREWDQVMLAQGLSDKNEYLESRRRGRGRSITRAQKESVWVSLSEVLGKLRRAGQYTHLQLADEATRILAERGAPPYRHILVDEGQDLHPAQWRLLRKAAAPDADDLFIVSDPNQRIYDNWVSLGSLGIEVRGRSHKLKVSYRTTQETLNWAARLLDGTAAEGLDDQPDTLAGYHSPMHGRRPIEKSYVDWNAELKGLVEQVQEWVREDVELSSIGIAARTRSRLADIKTALDQAGIACDRRRGTDAIQVGTMHSMKGDEHRCIALVGLDSDSAPLPAAVTPEEEDSTAHKHDMQRERCLLFVACTRNRDMLYVSYSGSASPFLPG